MPPKAPADRPPTSRLPKFEPPDHRACNSLTPFRCPHAVHPCPSVDSGLNEFEVFGVPTSLHICHDGRYPELWTLPVMFGARLVLQPSNGGYVKGSVDAFEATAKRDSGTTHAFHINVIGGGGSYLVGPLRHGNLLAASPECRRDNTAFPMVGKPQEGLFYARIRVADAFGYWPTRSFRASEATAEAYLSLYRTLGGRTEAGSQHLASAKSLSYQ